jgi:HD-GYP domain-containing protein (c-di-GMP phosphodiesterase class II)
MSFNVPTWAPEMAEALLQAVLKKDPFTFFHCCRVGRAARKFGEVLGLPEYEQIVLEFSGLFHDIGKVGIPDHILLKPGRLTNEELVIMKSHAEMSVDMIRPLTTHAFFRHVVPGVRYHHERYDGKGYPIEIKGEQIPFFARIISLVDSVDAMMHTRPYRQALGLDHVKSELVQYANAQFDPNLAQLYLANVDQMQDLDAGSNKEVIVAQLLKAA